MTEKLQRTEQVITEAELRTMLDDEDVDSFADLISRGVTQVRGGAWRREQDGHWRFLAEPRLVGRRLTRDIRSYSSYCPLWVKSRHVSAKCNSGHHMK